MKYRGLLIGLALVAAVVAMRPSVVRACGGFFCGQQPVDQQAERVLFAVGETSTTMIVQISYQGSAPDFAWVLPVAFVPDVEDLGTFPELAIAALDANTAPIFWRPDDPECIDSIALNGGGSDSNTPGVTVHLEETVGPYDVVVVEGTDATELVGWLRDNEYRISERMIPYVEEYTSEGMSLLALKLNPNAGVGDIAPFSIEMPTTAPSIPIRLTAVAAEPHMGILVFLLADERWGPSNWSEVEIDPGSIRYESHYWSGETNYLQLVAREVDRAGGRGWVTEMAGSTAPIVELAEASTPRDEEQREAQRALVDLLSAHPYLTRMYTRLSPEEMTVDPAFRPAGGPDVSRDVQLERYVDGDDLCDWDRTTDACDFAFCDPGSCMVVETTGWPETIPGCVCPDGMVARTTVSPTGFAQTACQDPAISLLDPGDTAGGSAPLPDPCIGYDCGVGDCVPVNMTPTCACFDGAVAVGWLDAAGARTTRCVDPAEPVDVPRPGITPAPDAGTGDMDAGGPPAGYEAGGGGGCAAVREGRSGAPVALAALLMLGMLRRRRR